MGGPPVHHPIALVAFSHRITRTRRSFTWLLGFLDMPRRITQERVPAGVYADHAIFGFPLRFSRFSRVSRAEFRRQSGTLRLPKTQNPKLQTPFTLPR